MRLTTGSTFIGDTTMRKVTLAATLLSLALVGSASAQQVVATDPVTGAATGAAAGAAQGAAVAGPVGALVGAPLGLAAGAVAGTLGAVVTVAGGLVGAPYAVAGGVYNYCPAGYTPVTPPNTLPPNITGVGYCQPLVAPVAYTQPVTTRVAYGAPRRAGARVAYAYPRRALARQVAYRTRAYGYRRVGFRTGPALGYRRVGFRTRATVGYRQVGLRTSRAFRAQRVGFRTGQAQGRMGAMHRALASQDQPQRTRVATMATPLAQAEAVKHFSRTHHRSRGKVGPDTGIPEPRAHWGGAEPPQDGQALGSDDHVRRVPRRRQPGRDRGRGRARRLLRG